MHIFVSLMGCKETKTIPPPPLSPPLPVANTTLPPVPIYVKSALKTPRPNGKSKSGKLTFLKKKSAALSKSVNFDEKVRVKVRTPTPNQTRYERSFTKQISNDDHYIDDDDQISSISSQDEDINHDQIKPSTPPSNVTLQRNQPNSFWYKSNATVTPSTKDIKEKPQQPPPPVSNILPNSPENPAIPVANRFRVRRKVQYSILPQSSSPVQLSVQTPTLPVQRTLPNTNTVLLEHHASYPNGSTSSKPAYYAFSRRPIDNKTSTDN